MSKQKYNIEHKNYAIKVMKLANICMPLKWMIRSGSLMKDATVWFDNKSMPLDTFKAKCLGQILLTGSYTVIFK